MYSSRFMNLKDRKNPQLRERVLSEEIAPHIFASMLATDMASSDLVALREKYFKAGLDDVQIPVDKAGSTDQFKCGKCLGRNCSYKQMQTRSADEPMTTFVTCQDCGNRWKFC